MLFKTNAISLAMMAIATFSATTARHLQVEESLAAFEERIAEQDMEQEAEQEMEQEDQINQELDSEETRDDDTLRAEVASWEENVGLSVKDEKEEDATNNTGLFLGIAGACVGVVALAFFVKSQRDQKLNSERNTSALAASPRGSNLTL